MTFAQIGPNGVIQVFGQKQEESESRNPAVSVEKEPIRVSSWFEGSREIKRLFNGLARYESAFQKRLSAERKAKW